MSTLAEPRRTAAVERVALVLDEDAERSLDRLTRLATKLFDVPVSLVSLVQPDRQIFKSCIGVNEPWASQREMPISHSYCQYAVLSAAPLVIEDARTHPVVRDNPAIRDISAVAYAGVPLVTSDGNVLGTFCVIDSKPRTWRDDEVELLEHLAAATMTEIEFRIVSADLRALERRHSTGGTEPKRNGGGLNIAAVARRTGVAPDTLRKWEQRYAILRPTRTRGGQRRYDDSDVARVEWLKARLAEGYRIGEAAALLGGASAPVPATPEIVRAALREAIERADSAAIARLLDQAFALGPVEATLAEVVRPTLEEVGELWAAGRFTVAQEHLVSGAVRARLDRLLADARAGVRGVALLACAPGERHELGLLMLAVLLRADGWQVAYLGADTPLADAFALAERLDARLVCLSAGLPDRLGELERELAATRVPPRVEIVAGGRAVTPEWAKGVGVLYVDGDLGVAIERFRELGG